MSSQFFANMAALLTVFVLLSSWYSSKLKGQEEEILLERKTNEIKNLQDEHKEEIQVKADSISRLQSIHQEELKGKAQKISELQQYLIQLQNVGLTKMEHQINMITGGDSYPILTLFQGSNANRERFEGTVFVSGNYPLRNLTFRVHRIVNGSGSKTEGAIDSLRQLSPLGVGEVIDLQGDQSAKLQVSFHADNGIWTQFFEFKKNEQGEFIYKTSLHAGQRKSDPTLVSSDYGEGIPIGSFENWDSRQFKGR